jgi:hypothetical protein
VLRSVINILSSFFYIWQCLELNLLSLIAMSQPGTLPMTITALSSSYGDNPVDKGISLAQTCDDVAISIVFSRLIY